MNIAFVTNEFVSESVSFDGGLSNYIYNISKFLIDDNHKVFVFVKSDKDKDEVVDFYGVKVIRVAFDENRLFRLLDVLTRFRKEKILRDFFQSYFFKKAIKGFHKQESIDVIHYSNLHLYFSFRPKGIPFVVRMSSYLPSLSSESDTSYLDSLILRERIERSLIKKYSERIFCPSFKLQRNIEKDTNCLIKVIESPFVEIDENTWDASARNLVPFDNYCLFFGRFIELKGVIELSKALDQLYKSGVQINFVFLGKDKDYKGRLMSEEIKKNIDSRYHSFISFLPSQGKRKLYPIINSADLVVLPSRTENLSNAGIESLALGKPLVGTLGASFEQIIENNKNGFLCQINDPKSIVDSINQFLAMPEKDKVEMGRLAAESMKRMSGNNISDHLVKFYQKNI